MGRELPTPVAPSGWQSQNMGMTTESQQAGQLPPEAEMDRTDALDAFLAVVNCCEPDHPHAGKTGPDLYPLERRNVNYGHTRSYYARCGPRNGAGLEWVSYSTRMTYINEIGRARHLALLVHEVSHITEGHTIGEARHPPSFWREVAFNALLIRDSIREGPGGAIPDAFGQVSEDRFLREVIEDPNAATVDRRSETVGERRAQMADLLGRPDLYRG